MSAKKKSGNNSLNRLGRYSITEVFEYMDASPRNGQRIKFYGHLMYLRSTRLLNFLVHGITCVKCQKRGAFFAKEHFKDGRPHLNLYGFDTNGQPMLMTMDHVKPKAKGGTNHLYNLQTMCVRCNSNKGNAWSLKDRLCYYSRRIKNFFSRNKMQG